MEIYDPGSFPYEKIADLKTEKRRRGNPARKDRRDYIHNIAAFDIETTRIEDIEQAFMYVWQFAVEGVGVCVGRTWPEFLSFLERVKQSAGGRWFKVFVHNLSYEFQFLRGIYDFSEKEVFIIRERKILKCEMLQAYEFCCSYLQTNMSLREFTREQEHAKTQYDYDKIRYPWTVLDPEEIEYIVNDVAGLIEAMRHRIEASSDDLYTLPATSTGYVRREVKRSMRHYNKDRLRDMLPDAEVFTMLREAFRGGDTHANRYYAGEILENVASYDRSSSYPDCQVNDIFPMGRWYVRYDVTVDSFLKHYLGARACVFRCFITNASLIDPIWPVPYIPVHKCRNLSSDYVNDNGRVLSGSFEITMTDVDFRIFLSEYDFDDIMIYEFASCSYKKLPKQITRVTLRLYRDKTELKGVTGQEDRYNRSKAMLNSIYGMSVQNPAQDEIRYIGGDYEEVSEPLERKLEKAYKNAFQSYAWGVWVTAWARYRLHEAIRIVGPDRFVYCDTDSVKFLEDPAVSFDWYNDIREKASSASGAVASDPKGTRHYMGVYEKEKTAKRFVTWGAKKYAYEDDAGLHLTCAGVGKISGARELMEAGGLEAFRPGFVFFDGGGTESVYNDDPEFPSWEAEGRTIPITSNVVIRPSTYTLDITDEYRYLTKIIERFN